MSRRRTPISWLSDTSGRWCGQYEHDGSGGAGWHWSIQRRDRIVLERARPLFTIMCSEIWWSEIDRRHHQMAWPDSYQPVVCPIWGMKTTDGVSCLLFDSVKTGRRRVPVRMRAYMLRGNVVRGIEWSGGKLWELVKVVE